MHVVIDARLYGPVGKGLGRYVERLIENLEIIDTENAYSVLLCQENFDLYTPRNTRWKKYCVPVRWYTVKEQFVIPWMLQRLKPDLVHFPHFNVPLFWWRPFVVTIHDLILLKHPSTRASTLHGAFYWLKYLAYRLVLRHAVRHARTIITVSNTVKKELEAKCQMSNVKCQVTYEACDGVLGSPKPGEGVEIGQMKIPESGWLVKRGITQPYFLYVGNAYPHKNLDFLISWFTEWQRKDTKYLIPNTQYHLILVGAEDYFYKQLRLRVARNSLRVTPIIFFGYATEPELADLYRNAEALIYPSLDEGFGLPPLEAMRYDCPVFASDIPALREVLGDAAIFFNPKSKESLTHAVENFLSVSNFRSAKISLGREQVKKYSWRRMAAQTFDIYNQSYKNSNH